MHSHIPIARIAEQYHSTIDGNSKRRSIQGATKQIEISLLKIFSVFNQSQHFSMYISQIPSSANRNQQHHQEGSGQTESRFDDDVSVATVTLHARSAKTQSNGTENLKCPKFCNRKKSHWLKQALKQILQLTRMSPRLQFFF